ncbi:MAG TPA: C4-dicarboxylate ABC transporter, partial [Pseudomonas sp.]|nr:C4-dicarboxylate ABC transporter [Pseudomonas sp.]
MFKSLVVAPCAALLLMLSPMAAKAAEPIVIKFAHVVADDTPKGKGA